MKPDDLDGILSREPEIVPSSGFTRSVMAAVRSEAAAPPPIPFPWKRAFPGIAVFAAAVASIASDGFRWSNPESVSLPELDVSKWMHPFVSALANSEPYGVRWLFFALLLTLACLKLTSILANREV